MNTRTSPLTNGLNNPLMIENKLQDEAGNKIIVEQSGKLFLKLNTEKNKRLLGQIMPARVFKVVRDRERHLFLKNRSYGFNYHILSNAKKFDTILLSDQFEVWKIPITFILENGQFLFFKQQGFEKQIFITLEQLKQFKKIPSF